MAGKDLAANVLQVVQGHDHPALLSRTLWADDCELGRRQRAGAGRATRRRRATARPMRACTLAVPAEGGIRLDFDAPQWAVTPGQSAVLYDGEVCLGGGVIQRAEAWAAARPSQAREPVDQ